MKYISGEVLAKVTKSPIRFTAAKILPEEMTYLKTTAIWEKSLKKIASGNKNFGEFYAAQLKILSDDRGGLEANLSESGKI